MNNDVQLVNFLDMPYDLRLESFKWRTAQHVDKYFQLHNLKLDGHKKWLDSMLGDNPKTIAFFICVNGVPVGATFFQKTDWGARTTDWGIYIYDTNMRGHGIGSEVLAKSMRYARDVMGMNKVFLSVLPTNTRAIHVYENAGFCHVSTDDNGVRTYVFDIPKEK